jgi:hypothetical protein
MTSDSQQQSWVRGTTITQRPYPATIVSGDGVPIMWQSKDAEVLARASTLLPTVQLSTVTLASETPETSKPSDTSEVTGVPRSGGLSTGAKIGIGVSIPIAVIIGIALGFLLWKRRRAHRTEHTRSLANEPPGVNAEKKDTLAAPAYFAGEQIHELHSPETHHSRHELPDVTHGH